MGLSQRNSAFLLAVVAVVCIQLYQAQYISGRCTCTGSMKNVRGNISDFLVIEEKPGCNKQELIVTVTRPDNSTVQVCVDTTAERGMGIIQCWKDINRNESRKMECMDKRRRRQSSNFE